RSLVEQEQVIVREKALQGPQDSPSRNRRKDVPIRVCMKPNTLLVAFLTACGTVNALPGSNDDSGNGSGSDQGSGSDMEPPHPPAQLYGHIHDERGDAIDYSTGEPVHRHDGASIDLSAGCPAVYKYAYLMDQSDPLFGRQATKNPLAWHVMTDVASLDASK